METPNDTRGWPDLAIGLYDKLTGRGAEITYRFEDLRVLVPSGTGDAVQQAPWRVDGTVRISTREEG